MKAKTVYFGSMKFLILFFTVICSNFCWAQALPADNEKIEKHGALVTYSTRDNDSTWTWKTYKILGPLIEIKSTSDRKGRIRNGASYFYSVNGSLDSVNNYRGNKRDGFAYSLEISGDHIHWKSESLWKEDQLIKTTAFSQTDSVGWSTRPLNYYSVSGYRLGLAKDRRDSTMDSIASTPEDTLQYLRRRASLMQYTRRNLRYPDIAVNNEITGNVLLFYSVEADGNIGKILILSSPDHSLDQEGIRVTRSCDVKVPVFYRDKAIPSFGEGKFSFRLATSGK